MDEVLSINERLCAYSIAVGSVLRSRESVIKYLVSTGIYEQGGELSNIYK